MVQRVQLEGDPGLDPGLPGGIVCLIPRSSWTALLERGTSGIPSLACRHCDLPPSTENKTEIDGWMNTT